MKRFILLFFLCSSVFAQPMPPPSVAPRALPPLPSSIPFPGTPLGSNPADLIVPQNVSPPTSLDLSGVPLSQVVTLYYQNNKRDFRMSPELLSDQTLVSFRFSGDVDRSFFLLLSSYGYAVSNAGGVEIISKIDRSVNMVPYLYKVKHVDPVKLSRLLSVFFPDSRFGLLGSVSSSSPTSSSNSSSPTSATALIDSASSLFLTYYGPSETLSSFKDFVEKVDIKPQVVEIRALLFESSISDVNSIGLSLFGSNGVVGTNMGQSAPNPTFSISSGGFTLALNYVKNSSNFKVVSSPYLLAESGQTSSLSIGSEIPVLSSVSYQDGTPVQSVEYRPSGSLLTIKPVIYQDSISISVRQELSEFVETTTSTVPSPTKLSRTIETNITVLPNSVVLLGGQSSDKVSSGKGGFFIFKNKQKTSSDSVLILMLFVGEPK